MTDTVRIPLQQVRVASPCHERWEDMKGDEIRRFCDSCGLYVHNLSAMTREQAEAFVIAATEQGRKRTCIRMYKRVDGTLITRDCPVGLAEVRHKTWARVRRAAAAVALAAVSLLGWRRAEAVVWWRGRTQTRGVMPYSWISEKLGAQAPSPSTVQFMGDFCIPPTPSFPQHMQDLAGLPRAKEPS